MATCFSTKMIRKYWLLEHKTDAYEYARTQMLLLPPVVPQKVQDEISNSRRLREMAHFLEIIRNLQSRLGSKYKRPGQEFVSCFTHLSRFFVATTFVFQGNYVASEVGPHILTVVYLINGPDSQSCNITCQTIWTKKISIYMYIYTCRTHVEF